MELLSPVGRRPVAGYIAGLLLGSSEAARSACRSVCGDARAPLLVVPAPPTALAGIAAPGLAFEVAVLARLRAVRPA